MTRAAIVVAVTLCGFGCGSDGPTAPTPPPVEIPKPQPPETPEPEQSPPPETPEPEPPDTPSPEPEPAPPETPEPEPSPEDPKPKPSPPEPSPPPPPPESPPEPPPPPPSAPDAPPPTIACACGNVRVGDAIVLRVEHPEIAGTGRLTYRWAATPGSDPVPGNSPTPRWNPVGSGQVEITAWVTGDTGTVVVSRLVDVTANPAPPPPPPPPPEPPPPPPPPEPEPEPPVQTKPWGAWSASSNSTVYGVAAGKASPDDANRAARADCQSKGGWGCAAGRPFQNQCVAVAHGLVTLHDPPRAPYPSSYYQIYASLDEPTQRAAEQAAMYQCVRGAGPLGSGTECRVLASICQP